METETSTTLKWRPSQRSRNSLPDGLLRIFRGWLESSNEMNVQSAERCVSRDSLKYLEGLRDAGVDGAQQVIDLIEEHGEVVLYLEY